MLLATITHVAPSYRWLTSSLRAPLYSESFNLHGRLRGSGRTSRSVQGLERMTTPERQPWKEMGFYRWCERRILCTKKTTPTHQQPRFHNPEAVPMASSYAASRTEVGPAEPRAISSNPDLRSDVVQCQRSLGSASAARCATPRSPPSSPAPWPLSSRTELPRTFLLAAAAYECNHGVADQPSRQQRSSPPRSSRLFRSLTCDGDNPEVFPQR